MYGTSFIWSTVLISFPKRIVVRYVPKGTSTFLRCSYQRVVTGVFEGDVIYATLSVQVSTNMESVYPKPFPVPCTSEVHTLLLVCSVSATVDGLTVSFLSQQADPMGPFLESWRTLMKWKEETTSF